MTKWSDHYWWQIIDQWWRIDIEMMMVLTCYYWNITVTQSREISDWSPDPVFIIDIIDIIVYYWNQDKLKKLW